jgi:ADP-ribose pyrophosphatase YjhB (NUDIX family)
MYKGLRLGVRAIIVRHEQLLLVNAYKPGAGPELWCAPGGGVDPHSSLHDNLKREVFEETGLEIDVGPVAMVNEFHDPDIPFHQVDIFFRASITQGDLSNEWSDPEGIVHDRRYFSMCEISELLIKPSSLPKVAFNPETPAHYDPLERMLR